MPVTIPNTFVTTTAIEASKIEENNRAIRDYMNKDIVVADISAKAIDEEEVRRGEIIYDRDHQFTSGEMYTIFIDGEAASRTVCTAHTKQAIDWTASPDFQIIQSTGKKFYLERDANIFFHGWIDIYSPDDTLVTGNTDGDEMEIYMVQDGTGSSGRLATTRALVFKENPTPTNSGAITTGIVNRRAYPICYLHQLSQGEHTISIVIDCTTDKVYASCRNITIEVLYI